MSDPSNPELPDIDQNPFQAPVSSSAPAMPVKMPLSFDPERYRFALTGLKVVYYTMNTVIVALILFMFLMCAGSASLGGPGQPPPAGILIAIGLFAIFLFGCYLAMFIGFCLCIAAPRQDEKSMSSAAVGLLVISVVVNIAGSILSNVLPEYLSLARALDFGADCAIGISMVLFALFCKYVGRNIGNSSVVNTASGAAYTTIIVVILVVTLRIFAPGLKAPENVSRLMNAIIGILGMFVSIGTLALVIYWLIMLRTTIKGLTVGTRLSETDGVPSFDNIDVAIPSEKIEIAGSQPESPDPIAGSSQVDGFPKIEE